MKVLYFHQHFSTPKGAAGNRSYAFSKKLLEQGHEVTVVCGSYGVGHTGLESEFSNGRRQGVYEGIRIIEFDLAYTNSTSFMKRAFLFVLFAVRSTWVALTESYDVVFATSTPLTAGIPGIAARWLRRKKFVFEVRDLWPELPREMGVIRNPIVLSAMSILEWVSYHSAHKLVGLSPGIVEGIQKRGIEKSQIKMIPNGCDIDFFENGQTARRPSGVSDNDLVAIFAGTHGVANGLNSVIEVAQVLKFRGIRDIKLVLIGDGALKKDLVLQAEQKKLDNIIFLDPISRDRLVNLLNGADLGLQLLADIPAFYFGTSPNKFFDYIAAGLPVLNNYPGWLAGIIDDNNCGFCVEPNDSEAFADALIKARDRQKSLKMMGERAKLLAKERFDRDMLAQSFVDTLGLCR